MPTPPPSRTVPVGLVQMRCTADAADNLARAVAGVRTAAAKGARRSSASRSSSAASTSARRRTTRIFALAEAIPGPEHRGAGRGGGGARRRDRRLALRAARRGALPQHRRGHRRRRHATSGKYRKMHIPDDPLFYEKFYFTPGDLGFRVFDTAVRPDRRADLLGPVVSRGGAPHRAARGADPLLPDRDRLAAGREGGVRRARSRTPGRRSSGATRSPTACFVVAVNRVGHEGLTAANGIEFWGGSFVADPSARVLAKAGEGEEVLVVDCDLALIDVAAHALALPPRPPHRRLRRPHPAVPRRVSTPRHHATPAELGYRMPAEWEPHRGTWLSLAAPARRPGPASSGRCRASSREMVRHLAPHEEVHINVTGAGRWRREVARGSCSRASCPPADVFFHHIPTNDAWCRDHGPDLRPAHRRTGGARRRSSTGATTPGAASTRRSTSTTSFPRRIGRGVRHPGVPPGHRDGGRLAST